MSDLKLDIDTYDLSIENNDLAILTGLDAKVQRLKQEFKTFLGEWFLDTTKGVPWLQKIFKKNVNPSEVDAILKDVILSSEDVIELQEFNLDLDPATRKLTLVFRVRFAEGVGTIEISEVI